MTLGWPSWQPDPSFFMLTGCGTAWICRMVSFLRRRHCEEAFPLGRLVSAGWGYGRIESCDWSKEFFPLKSAGFPSYSIMNLYRVGGQNEDAQKTNPITRWFPQLAMDPGQGARMRLMAWRLGRGQVVGDCRMIKICIVCRRRMRKRMQWLWLYDYEYDYDAWLLVSLRLWLWDLAVELQTIPVFGFGARSATTNVGVDCAALARPGSLIQFLQRIQGEKEKHTREIIRTITLSINISHNLKIYNYIYTFNRPNDMQPIFMNNNDGSGNDSNWAKGKILSGWAACRVQ